LIELPTRASVFPPISWRPAAGKARKHAQALLEHLDAQRVTRRLPDDARVLRRRQAAGR